MTSLTKVGVASIVGTIMAPAALINTQRYDASGSVPGRVENAHAFLTKYGYYEKRTDKLVEFEGGRDNWTGGNFALGCHRVLFGGKNVPKFWDTHLHTRGHFQEKSPRTDYFGDEKQPVLGCATAALLDSPKGKVYEFELALKRGEKGFLERVSVEDTRTRAQLTFLHKNENDLTKKEHPWIGVDGIQRTDGSLSLQISDPKFNNWPYLNLNSENIKTPQYFVVWVDDNNGKGKVSNPKGIFEGLGVRFSYSQKPFSSILGNDPDANWELRYFGHDNKKLNPSDTHNLPKLRPNYTSRMDREITSLRGAWKDVTEFCNSQISLKERPFLGDDLYRLRDYCYTKNIENSWPRYKQIG